MFTFKEILPEHIEKASDVTGHFKIAKSDDDKRLAFGWANVSVSAAGKQLLDWHDDMIDIDELEQAAYRFVEFYREGGEMHERGGCAVLIESMIFTKEKQTALGLPDNTVPEGWWVGFRVTDDDVWAKVKSGEYPMFSIEGKAVRIPTENE